MEAKDYDDRTALHVAAAEGHLNVITTLIEKCKMDVNPRDRYESFHCIVFSEFIIRIKLGFRRQPISCL